MYRYTQLWFLFSEIREKIFLFLNPTSKYNMLEIGCFEGLSSTFFADNFLLNENSSLTCVDPFLTIDTNDHKEFLKGEQEGNFDYNISHCYNNEKIKIKKITSDAFFKDNRETFNFIYIDGCHEPDFVLRDMENSFNVLEEGGIMWMDDYLGGDGIQIKNAMDTFLRKYNGKYEIIHSGYQLALRKI